MQFCEFVITLGVFENWFCGWWRRVVEGLRRLVVRIAGTCEGRAFKGTKPSCANRPM